MQKEEFRRTEGLLYNYFKQPKQIENIRHHIELLNQQIDELNVRIKETDVNIDTYTNMGIDYSSEKVQTSFHGSYAENEVCRQVKELEKRRDRKKVQVNELLNRIQDIDEANQIIHDNLKYLNDECKKFIRYKYRNHRSCDWIAIEMYHGARATVFRKRNELVENIAQWFIFTKT